MFSFFRVITFAIQDFYRNFWLSFITITIFFLALLTVNFFIVFNVVSDAALHAVEDRIDIFIQKQKIMK